MSLPRSSIPSSARSVLLPLRRWPPSQAAGFWHAEKGSYEKRASRESKGPTHLYNDFGIVFLRREYPWQVSSHRTILHWFAKKNSLHVVGEYQDREASASSFASRFWSLIRFMELDFSYAVCSVHRWSHRRGSGRRAASRSPCIAKIRHFQKSWRWRNNPIYTVLFWGFYIYFSCMWFQILRFAATMETGFL